MSELEQQALRQGLAALKRQDWKTGVQLLDPLLATAEGGDRTQLLTVLAQAYRRIPQPWLANLRTEELHRLPSAPAWTGTLLQELQPQFDLPLPTGPTASLPPWGIVSLLALVLELTKLLQHWLAWPLLLLLLLGGLGIAGLTRGRSPSGAAASPLDNWLGPLELRGREWGFPTLLLGFSLLFPVPYPGLWIAGALLLLGLWLFLSFLPLAGFPQQLGWQPLQQSQLFRSFSSSARTTCWLIPVETVIVVSFGSVARPHFAVSQGFLGRLPQAQRDLLLQRERCLREQRCGGLIEGLCLLTAWVQQPPAWPGQLWLLWGLKMLLRTLEGASRYRAYLGDRPIAGRTRLPALTQALVADAMLLGQDLARDGCSHLLFSLDLLQPVRLSDAVLCSTPSTPLLLTAQTTLGERLSPLAGQLLPPLSRLNQAFNQLLRQPCGLGALAATLLGSLLFWLALLTSLMGQGWADPFWSDPTWLLGMPWLGAAAALLAQFNQRFSPSALETCQGDWLAGPLPLLRTDTDLIVLRAPTRSAAIACRVKGWRRQQFPNVIEVDGLDTPQDHQTLIKERLLYLATGGGCLTLGLYLLLV
jgi:hypothetical protein